jgi:hypothetical protein
MGSKCDYHQVLPHKQKGRYFEVEQRSFFFVVRFEKRVLASGCWLERCCSVVKLLFAVKKKFILLRLGLIGRQFYIECSLEVVEISI